jgi:hypothetical protein
MLSKAASGVERAAPVEHVETSEATTTIPTLANADAASWASPAARERGAPVAQWAFGIGTTELRASRTCALAGRAATAVASSAARAAKATYGCTGAVSRACAGDGNGA